MPSLNDLKGEALFTMLKGEPGTRKSTQALSYPKPQYWFSMDQKMRALKIPARLWGIDKVLIDHDDYSGADLNHSWNAALKKMESFQLNCKYKTIILDSVTSTGDVINLQTIELKGKEKRDSGDREAKETRKVGSIPVDGFDEYKAETSAFRDAIATLKDIQKYHNCHIILIAHVVGERKPEERGITSHARIIITGGKAISGKISAYCEETYHFDVSPNPDPSKMPNYKIITTHVGADYARTTLFLPKEIEFNDKPLYETWIKPAIIELEK